MRSCTEMTGAEEVCSTSEPASANAAILEATAILGPINNEHTISLRHSVAFLREETTASWLDHVGLIMLARSLSCRSVMRRKDPVPHVPGVLQERPEDAATLESTESRWSPAARLRPQREPRWRPPWEARAVPRSCPRQRE